MVNCDSLSIEGDVFFESGVTIKDRVTIKNRREAPALVKKGTVIEGDMVF